MPKAIRQIRVVGNIAYVPLTQGYEAVIDVADMPLVDGFSWCATVSPSGNVYAIRRIGRQAVWMHRIIMGEPAGLDVDHRDSNGLNNRRGNLRTATDAQNNQNARKSKNNTSGYKGVAPCKQTGRWEAYIGVNGKKKRLGRFRTPEAAHAAYVEASARLHGDFGRTA